MRSILSFLAKIVLPPVVSYGIIIAVGYFFFRGPEAFVWIPWIAENEAEGMATVCWAGLTIVIWYITFVASIETCERAPKFVRPIAWKTSEEGYCDGCGENGPMPCVMTKGDNLFCKACVKVMHDILPS